MISKVEAEARLDRAAALPTAIEPKSVRQAHGAGQIGLPNGGPILDRRVPSQQCLLLGGHPESFLARPSGSY